MRKVSVIIPVYGIEKYVAATVQSVLAQTYDNFELLIIDDASPDRSIEICQQFTDCRIKIIHQKNRGLAGARNTGIRHAQGEYLAFLDGDDLWLPEKLEKHIAHLEKSPKVGISFSRSAFIDEAGKPLGIYQMPKLKDISPQLILCRNPIGNGSAAVVRREVFEDIKYQENLYGLTENFYFDEKFRQSEDVEFWLRVAIQTHWLIEGIPEALTLYRVNSGGLSANLSKQLEGLEKIIQKTRSYAPDAIACENLARAYYLRYAARRAVSLKAPKMAVSLINQALVTHLGILLQEPRRTLLTIAAAYSLCFLPQPLFEQVQNMALKLIGVIQKSRILQEEAKQTT
jgi:glycosyltransferase involved in cell wall biosynthesis